MAAGVLLVMGLPLGWWGMSIAVEGLGHGPGSGGVMEAMVGFGMLLGLVAGLHIGAALQIWTGRGRMLGLIVGTIGAFAGGVGLSITIDPIVRAGASTALDPIDVTLILLPVPYLIALVVLLWAEGRDRALQGSKRPYTRPK